MRCERCQASTAGYQLHDYCAACSKNLCEKCMAVGCCGSTPARSGSGDDLQEADDATAITPGTRPKHVAYLGDIVTVVEALPDGRYLIDRGHRRTKVSEKTIRAEYTADLEAPVRMPKRRAPR